MLKTREGQRVPNVKFKQRENDQWVEKTSDDLFKGKKVVVFSLPGAYTPTCSSSQMPRYNELAATFKQNGISDVICISVNDAFVMNAWRDSQNAKNIYFLADGNGEFTEGMGMLVDKTGIGFGKRSWRYSMLVNDGVVEKMFIEPEKEGDPFEVSDADTMLKHINPKAASPEFISVITRKGCPHCARAKKLLESKGLAYEEIVTGEGVTSRSVRAISGRSTVPQIFIGGKHIGGADDLEKYFAGK